VATEEYRASTDEQRHILTEILATLRTQATAQK
jgi:hypothetical protein